MPRFSPSHAERNVARGRSTWGKVSETCLKFSISTYENRSFDSRPISRIQDWSFVDNFLLRESVSFGSHNHSLVVLWCIFWKFYISFLFPKDIPRKTKRNGFNSCLCRPYSQPTLGCLPQKEGSTLLLVPGSQIMFMSVAWGQCVCVCVCVLCVHACVCVCVCVLCVHACVCVCVVCVRVCVCVLHMVCVTSFGLTGCQVKKDPIRSQRDPPPKSLATSCTILGNGTFLGVLGLKFFSEVWAFWHCLDDQQQRFLMTKQKSLSLTTPCHAMLFAFGLPKMCYLLFLMTWGPGVLSHLMFPQEKNLVYCPSQLTGYLAAVDRQCRVEEWLFPHAQSSFRVGHWVPDEAASAELRKAEAVHWASTLHCHIKDIDMTTLCAWAVTQFLLGVNKRLRCMLESYSTMAVQLSWDCFWPQCCT